MEIQAVRRAFSILEYVCDAGKAGVSEIARELDLNKSTAFGLIRTLVQAGYLQQIQNSTEYELSLKVCNLSSNVLGRIQVREYARPLLEELSEKYGETVHLVTASPRECIYIDKVESTSSIRIFTSIGNHLPLHATGVGKSILAMRKREEQEKYVTEEPLQRFTDTTITDPQSLLKELEEIRLRGYGFDHGERFPDVFCLAVPILNQAQEPVYSVSISMPHYRSQEDNSEQIAQDLFAVKEKIERIL